MASQRIKGSGCFENKRFNKPSALNCYQRMRSPMVQANKRRKVRAGANCLTVKNNTGFEESCSASARTSKRASPLWSSDFEIYEGNVDKKRVIEKQNEGQQVVSRYPSPFLKVVDDVPCLREYLGEIYVHDSYNNQMIGSCEMERGAPNYFVDSVSGRSSEPNDSNIDACSVGSCSVTSDSPNKLSSRVLAGNYPDADNLSNDAESFYGRGEEEEHCSIPLGEDVAARIHKLELHAYCCTLGVFYASGPLSWEQEALLTNLRISLDISNDEHLMEIRNLISAGTSINIS